MLYHNHSYTIANTITNSGIRIITDSITTTSINNTDTHTNTNTKTLVLILIRTVVIIQFIILMILRTLIRII